MLYALNDAGEKTRATPGISAYCPGCHAPMIAKCGNVIIHHWAHAATEACGTWEPETEWHLAWKARFPAEWVEVFRDGRRADVLLPTGQALEFQRRRLDPDTIRAREEAWGQVTWIANAEGLDSSTITAFGEETGIPRLDLRPKYRDGRLTHTNFRWRHARRSWMAATKPPILDLGDDLLFEIRKINWEDRVGGWGHTRTIDQMLQRWKVPQHTHTQPANNNPSDTWEATFTAAVPGYPPTRVPVGHQ